MTLHPAEKLSRHPRYHGGRHALPLDSAERRAAKKREIAELQRVRASTRPRPQPVSRQIMMWGLVTATNPMAKAEVSHPRQDRQNLDSPWP
jgi:hypothetical protein